MYCCTPKKYSPSSYCIWVNESTYTVHLKKPVNVGEKLKQWFLIFASKTQTKQLWHCVKGCSAFGDIEVFFSPLDKVRFSFFLFLSVLRQPPANHLTRWERNQNPDPSERRGAIPSAEPQQPQHPPTPTPATSHRRLIVKDDALAPC